MQQIYSPIEPVSFENRISRGKKVISFFKGSFLLPFIFGTLLYILMRVFFIGSEFSNAESIELYVKTFMVTWSYINLWRLICHGIIWLESRTNRVKMARLISLPLLKKTAIFIIVAGLAYKTNAGSLNWLQQSHVQDTVKNSRTDRDIDPRFYFWMK